MLIRSVLAVLLFFTASSAAVAVEMKECPRFEISFPASVHEEPITGRLLLMLSKSNQPEVRYQVGWVNTPPVFGIDVSKLPPGRKVVIDRDVPGFPLHSLKDIPPGDYYVQALLNVYTEFHRADGHVIWAHMDHWEGQHFSMSPGNLFSVPKRLRWDPSQCDSIKLSLTELIPPVKVPPDTQWVKHVKIQSDLLTRFWGRPMYLGAVVLLPKDYELHPNLKYPVVYQQGHFSLEAPFGFRTDNPPETNEERLNREANGVETGYQFSQAWSSDSFPRMIAGTLLHPTPYYDDSYAVDSVNNGPYGTAILRELIPYIEKQFRIIASPYARVLVGGSTGGWEALALQLFHPEFFDGAWALYPDPVDFRRFQLLDIYRDENSYIIEPRDVPGWAKQVWTEPERSFARSADGQSVATVRQVSQLESVLGSKGRSGGQLAIWNAAFGPVGVDGYPEPLWDAVTGEINHKVAAYMRDHGYDLRYYTETNWPRIGSKLSGKLNLYCGDMDNFYLNLGVYLFENLLDKVDSHDVNRELEYGRPLKGHGWQPVTNAELVRIMATRISRQAPPDAKLASR